MSLPFFKLCFSALQFLTCRWRSRSNVVCNCALALFVGALSQAPALAGDRTQYIVDGSTGFDIYLNLRPSHQASVQLVEIQLHRRVGGQQRSVLYGFDPIYDVGGEVSHDPFPRSGITVSKCKFETLLLFTQTEINGHHIPIGGRRRAVLNKLEYRKLGNRIRAIWRAGQIPSFDDRRCPAREPFRKPLRSAAHTLPWFWTPPNDADYEGMGPRPVVVTACFGPRSRTVSPAQNHIRPLQSEIAPLDYGGFSGLD